MMNTLGNSFHHDPADRIVEATARVHCSTLVTQDRRMTEAKLVDTLS